MPFWIIALVILAATVVLGELLKPKISDSMTAARLDEFNIPTVDATRPVPVGWGTFEVKGANVVWYGDYKAEAKKKKVKTGLFSSKRVTTGFRYFIAFNFALCFGPNTELIEILANEKSAWQGTASGLGAGTTFTVDAKNLFGGDAEESDGEGGLYAVCDFYAGTSTQPKNPYLLARLGNVNARRGVSHLVWRGPSGNTSVSLTGNPLAGGLNINSSGYIGISPNLKPFAFRCRRIPNFLGVPTYSNINSGDANPAEVIYEIIVNGEWGVGLAPSLVDVPSFQYAAQVLHSEGIGFSALWDTSKPCDQLINDIKRLIDGVLYTDLSTGLLKIKLARADYDVDDLQGFDEANCKLESYSRGAWLETTNEVRVPFLNRFNHFKDSSALAQDLANMRIQGATVGANIEHIGISNQATADSIAWRDLRALTLPLAKITVQATRDGAFLIPAGTFKFSWKKLEDTEGNAVQNSIMRVVRVKYGTLEDGTVTVEAIEDVFSLGSPVYSTPAGTTWVEPISAPAATATARVEVQPYFFSLNALSLWAFAARPGASNMGFDVYVAKDGVNYALADEAADFSPTGTLVNPYSRATAAKDVSGAFRVAPTADLERLLPGDANTIGVGFNLLLIDNEIMAFTTFTVDAGTGDYIFSGEVWRGLLDTVPQDHAAGARVWFFSYGDATPDDDYASGTALAVRNITRSAAGTLALTSAPELAIIISSRALRPLAPGNVRINGTYNATAIPATGNVVVAWAHRNRQSGMVVAQDAGNDGPEPNSTYTLKIYGNANALLRTVALIPGTSYTYTNATETADAGALQGVLTFVLYSQREGLTSYQPQKVTVARPGGVVPGAQPAYSPSGTYVPITPGTATNINGTPITGTPTGTNNTPVFNPTSGQIEWAPGGSLTLEQVRDAVAAFIVATGNLSAVHDDAADTLTLSTTALNTEEVRDLVAGFIVAGANITAVHDDAGNTLTITATSHSREPVAEDGALLFDVDGDVIMETI